MASSQVYEVRCERCRTSFAPETRRCVHCGGPLHAGRVVASVGRGQPPAEPDSGRLPADPDEAQEELAFGSRGRGFAWALMVILALVGSLVRNCQS